MARHWLPSSGWAGSASSKAVLGNGEYEDAGRRIPDTGDRIQGADCLELLGFQTIPALA